MVPKVVIDGVEYVPAPVAVSLDVQGFVLLLAEGYMGSLAGKTTQELHDLYEELTLIVSDNSGRGITFNALLAGLARGEIDGL